MNILVLYQSRSGHTQQTAHAIAEAARKQSHALSIKSVIEVQESDITNAGVLFIGTWV